MKRLVPVAALVSILLLAPALSAQNRKKPGRTTYQTVKLSQVEKNIGKAVRVCGTIHERNRQGDRVVLVLRKEGKSDVVRISAPRGKWLKDEGKLKGKEVCASGNVEKSGGKLWVRVPDIPDKKSEPLVSIRD